MESDGGQRLQGRLTQGQQELSAVTLASLVMRKYYSIQWNIAEIHFCFVCWGGSINEVCHFPFPPTWQKISASFRLEFEPLNLMEQREDTLLCMCRLVCAASLSLQGSPSLTLAFLLSSVSSNIITSKHVVLCLEVLLLLRYFVPIVAVCCSWHSLPWKKCVWDQTTRLFDSLSATSKTTTLVFMCDKVSTSNEQKY